MLNEKLKAKGTLTLKLVDVDGNIISQDTHNLVVDTGLAHIISRMVGTAQAVMSHMAIGTGVTVEADGDTTLQTEIARVALTSSTITTTAVANDSVQYEATFPAATGTGAITEAGLFNNDPGGTMLSRTVFSVINKGAADSLVVTWKIQVQ